MYQEFRTWIDSVLFSNRVMHTDACATGIGARPDIIQCFDPEAARLLQNVRDAHDVLTRYLKTKLEQFDVNPPGVQS
jgi:hypothetical protein